MHFLHAFVYFTMSLTAITSDQTCSHHRQRFKHRFYALRHCQRSNRTIVGLTSVNNVAECADYARKKRGMAFNFGPKNRNDTNLFDVLKDHKPNPPKGSDTITLDPEEFFNCQVLECPENKNFSSIVNDTRFDYYSLYTRPRPSGNVTCLPSVGMFIYSDRKANYSVAFDECRSLGGSLAHVASEGRTNLLSKMVANGATNLRNTTKIISDGAYVGLNETVRGSFSTSSDEPLDCFLYRAWAPGHPSKNRQPGCVTITSNNSWTVQNCNKPNRFICELHTSGPPVYTPRLRRKCFINRPNNRITANRNNASS